MISKVNFDNSPIINYKSNYNQTNNNLERSPLTDTVCFKGKQENELTPELKEILDNKIFQFKKNNGELFEGTIKDYFENSIINWQEAQGKSFIHCTSTKDTAEKIIKEGLDWQKTSRMRCGPGTYFSPSAAGGYEQGGGSVSIKAEYLGLKDKYPVFEPCFYEAVQQNNELKNILPVQNSPKLLNKYCHDLLQNDLDIDFLYAGSGRGVGAYVVINDDCVKLSKDY